MELGKSQVTSIVQVAIMAVLVFLATYLVKVPVINGYVHIGDALIFLSVYVLGVKKGALASAFGASLSDFISGYFIWIFPTFFIKWVIAIVMGVISLVVLKKSKFNFIIGCSLACVVQVILYAIFNIIFYGNSGIFTSVVFDLAQTLVGIIFYLGVVYFLETSGMSKLFKSINK